MDIMDDQILAVVYGGFTCTGLKKYNQFLIYMHVCVTQELRDYSHVTKYGMYSQRQSGE